MNFTGFVNAIYKAFLPLVPMFRVAWAATTALGLGMLIIAMVLKKEPARKKSPWIVGTIGILIMLSSGTQFIMSFF